MAPIHDSGAGDSSYIFLSTNSHVNFLRPLFRAFSRARMAQDRCGAPSGWIRAGLRPSFSGDFQCPREGLTFLH
jgi:hypothetical protein